MFGPKMHRPEGVAGEREQRVLDRWNVSIDQFERYSKVASGTRRPLIVGVENLSIEQEPDGLRFQFTLPKGTYATMLLREFMRNEDE
jgi:tRNA pseudouridine13 synthase